MSTAILAPSLILKSWRNDGTPNANGTVQTLAAGTTSNIVTYTDSTAGTPNANPITLNARGEAPVWVLPNVGYKFVEYDSSGNLLRTTDQVTQQQLISLYAGIDTGVVNAYILSYNAPYSTYQDGIVIYWTPSVTNTSGSTVNVSFNGGASFAGVKSILNQDGSALTAGQLVGGTIAFIIYQSGHFVLTTPFGTAGAALVPAIVVGSPTGGNEGVGTVNAAGGYYLNGANMFTSGSYTGTLVGCTTSPTATFHYTKNGNSVTIDMQTGLSGTSNTTSMAILSSGMPAAIRPARTTQEIIIEVIDNGVSQIGQVSVANDGAMNFYVGFAGLRLFTNSGTKGFNWLLITYSTV